METPLTLNNAYVLELLFFLFFSKVNSCVCVHACVPYVHMCMYIRVCMFCRYNSICT